MAYVYTVTPSTSIIRISTLQSPYTLVLLSSINYPGHLVTIKDVTGNPEIAFKPILISTTQGITFLNGTFSTLITQTNESMTFSSRDSNSWEQLNTVGFLASLSTAVLNTLTTTNIYSLYTSSILENASSFNTNFITATNSVNFQGDSIVGGDLIVRGNVNLFSTIFIKQNVSSLSSFYVSGPTVFASSLTVKDKLTLFSTATIQKDFIVGSNLYVSTSFTIQNALIPQNFSVQTIHVSTLRVGGGIRVAGNLSVGSNLYVSTLLSLENIANFDGSISIRSNAIILDSLIMGNPHLTYSISSLLTFTDLQVSKDSYLNSLLSIDGSATFSDTMSTGGTLVASTTIIQSGNLLTRGTLTTEYLTALSSGIIDGSAIMTTLSVLSTMGVGGNASGYGGNLNTSVLAVGGSIGIGNNVYVGSMLIIDGSISSFKGFNIGQNLIVASAMSTFGNLAVNGSTTTIGSVYVKDFVDTNSFSTLGSGYINTSLDLDNLITTSSFISFIPVSTNSLVLSNRLDASYTSSALFITTNMIPQSTMSTNIYVNASKSLNNGGQDLYVNATAMIASSIVQISSPSIFYTSRILASSIQINSLSTLQIGSTILNAYSTNLFYTLVNSISTFTWGSSLSTSIINVPSVFKKDMSTNILIANNVTASLIMGTHFGDGSGLSNLTNMNPHLFTSTLSTGLLYSHASFVSQFVSANTVYVEKLQEISTFGFFSTQNEFIVAGQDVNGIALIQTTIDGSKWKKIQGVSQTFSINGYNITTNDDPNVPFYVAVGADINPLRTILWSYDTLTWNPIQVGGFPYTVNRLDTLTNYGVGFDVAYAREIGTWLALGADLSYGSNTLQYSRDGQLWYPCVNSFAIGVNPVYDRSKIDWNGSIFLVLGADDINNYNLKYSGDGINWSNTGIQASASAWNSNTSTWYAINGQTTYTSSDAINWSSTTNTVPNQYVFTNLVWNGSYWLALGFQQARVYNYGGNIYRSTDAVNWSVSFIGIYNSILLSLYWSSVQQLWVAGLATYSQEDTILNSVDGITWNAIKSGGFESGIKSAGAGYSIFISTNGVLLTGKASGGPFDFTPQIIGNNGTDFPTKMNISTNVNYAFNRQINALGFEPSMNYPWVAVGDGKNASKTIARTTDYTKSSNWQHAVTGGFSTSGYGLLFNSNTMNWLAVGQANSTNTIQYSHDGASWFGTNDGVGMRKVGYAITKGTLGSSNLQVIVGQDVSIDPKRTIVYNNGGKKGWSTITSGGFSIAGRGVAPGLVLGTSSFIAVGQANAVVDTIQTTSDASNWASAGSGGFNIGGYGVGYSPECNVWVAVGQDTNFSNSIQYSDDGVNWNPAITGSFTHSGNAVAWIQQSNVWLATGQDLYGNTLNTIKYSGDGSNWSNLLGGGFQPVFSFGTAFGFTNLNLNNVLKYPYLTTCNLVIYEDVNSLGYTTNTIRSVSSFMTINETMFVNNILSQVVITSNLTTTAFTPDATLSVYNDVLVSSIKFYPGIKYVNVAPTGTVLTSSISAISYFFSNHLITSTLKIGLSSFDQVSRPTLIEGNASQIQLNNSFFISRSTIGIATSTPSYSFTVNGTVVASTLTGYEVRSPFMTVSTINDSMLRSPYLNLVNTRNLINPYTNTIVSLTSSLTFNLSTATLNISSQKIGFNTLNPVYDLEVQMMSYVSSLNTSMAYPLVTGNLFLTGQYL